MPHSIHNAPTNRAGRLTPEKRARIIKMKRAKVCSVEICAQLDVTGSQIDKTWQTYRRAHPGTPTVGTGVHAQRRPNLAKGVH